MKIEEKEKLRKQRILDAALALIKEKGIENITMREIAAKAGLTTGAIYYSYKNKDELFHDIVNESIHFSTKIFSDYQAQLTTNETLLKDICNAVALRLSKKDEQLLHLTLLLSLLSDPQKEQYRKELESNYRQIIKNTGDLFAPAFQINDSKKKYTMAALLTAAIDGMAILSALDIFPENDDITISSFLDFFTSAIPAYLENEQ